MKNKVAEKFSTYPEPIEFKLEQLRSLIFQVAKEQQLGAVEESLKWGEPSYRVQGGSPIRIDWKEKTPEQYAMYFNCNTKLVDTFRVVYGDLLEFQGNRAIVFDRGATIPVEQLKHCIEMALKYHSVKNLPLLGA